MAFLPGFFHLACFQASSVLWHGPVLHSFSWLNNISWRGWHILFVPSSVNGHLSRFYLLALVNSAAMNIHAKVFVVFNLLRNQKLFSTAPAPFYVPPNNRWRLQFPHMLTNTYFPFVLLIITIQVDVKPYRLVVLFCISFTTNDVKHLFMYLPAMCIYSLKQFLFKSFARF